MKYIKILALNVLLFVPGVISAQNFLVENSKSAGTEKTFSSFVYGLGGVFETIMSIILALSLLAFLGGLAVRLLNIGSSEKQSQAKYIMVYGVLGLVISFTIVGFLNLGLNTFFISLIDPYARFALQ